MATLNTNVTTASGLSATMQTYYDKKLLLNAKPKLVFYRYGQQRPIKNGKAIKFRKWKKFGTLTTPLTEGVVPDGQTLTMTEINATAAQYGGYIAVSDFLDMTALDTVISDSTELMGDQGGETVNEIIANEIFSGTNVQYAGNCANRGLLDTTNVLTLNEVKKAVRTLKKADAPKYTRNGRGYYVCFVNPDASYALMCDDEWIDVSKYAAAEQIFDGELGKAYGVIFVESTTTPTIQSEIVDGLSLFTVKAWDGTNKKITVEEDISSDQATALANKKVNIDGDEFTISSATAGTGGTGSIVLSAAPTTAPTAGNVFGGTNAGKNGLSITQTLVFGNQAYGVSEIGKGTSADPSRIHTIVKPRGSAGSADPLDQISTIGWKVDGFVCKRLTEEWMVRIESAIKDPV